MKVRGARCLLNGPGLESTAAVVAEVEDSRGWKDGCFRKGEPLSWDDETPWHLAPDVIFQVSNCDRSIGWLLRWETAAERRNSLEKVDRLIKAFVVFRAALVEEQELYAERLKRAKKAGPPAAKKPA